MNPLDLAIALSASIAWCCWLYQLTVRLEDTP